MAHGLVRILQDQEAKEGLHSEDAKPERWVVNAKEMCLAIDSVVPSSKAGNVVAGSAALPPKGGLMIDPALGIKPLAIKPMDKLLDAHLEFHVTHRNAATIKDDEASGSFQFVPIVKKLPTALWNPEGNGAPDSDNHVETTPALTGYTMHPATLPLPGASHWVKDQSLEYESSEKHVREDGLRLTRASTPTPPAKIRRRASPPLPMPDPALLVAMGFDPHDDVRLADSLPRAFVVRPVMSTLSVG